MTRNVIAPAASQANLAPPDYLIEAMDAFITPITEAPGCNHCNSPLFLGRKCKNCGKVYWEDEAEAQAVSSAPVIKSGIESLRFHESGKPVEIKPVAWLADTPASDDPALFFDRHDAEQSGYSFVQPLFTTQPPNHREAMEKALESLEGIHPGNMTPMAEESWNKAIAALKKALGERLYVNT